MPDNSQDSVFTKKDLKAILLKSMTLSWQNAYRHKDKHASDNFCQMLSYFVQSQSIGNSQVASKPSFLLSQYILVGTVFKWSFQTWLTWPFHINIFGGQQNSCIYCKSNNGPRGVYLDYCGPCPVHPTLTHKWDDCFNNPQNNFTGSQHASGQERGGQTRHGSYYSK